MKSDDRPHGLERRLVAIVLACLLLPTLTVGWIGYSEAYHSITSEKIQNVGIVADARHDALVTILQRTRARGAAFLSDVNNSCHGGDGALSAACLTDAMQSFTKTERALGAVLHISKTGRDLVTGASEVRFDDWKPFQSGQLARFSEPNVGNDRTYDVVIEDYRLGLWLAVTFPVSLIQGLFTNSPYLGQSGETFLSDASGFFITKGRYPSAQGTSHPISAHPMQACLAMDDREILDQDYRDVAVIHGFRFVPEIGGGCIMAHIDQAEAFAPLRTLQWRMATLTLLFIAVATMASLAIGHNIAKPLVNLTQAIREIINGNYDARVDVTGSREITNLAESFNRMAARLQLTLGELREQKACLEDRVKERTAELETANRRLAALSMIDGLTGLANRRQLDEVLESEWRRAARQCLPLALVMADVDLFKDFNDHYGHQAGDECLRRVASVLAEHTQRAGELATRYGGEEFAIILPGVDLVSASSWAEEVRQAVIDLAIPHELSKTGIVTLCLGVSCLIPDASSKVSNLISEADKALYQAKRGGRNQVVGMCLDRSCRPRPVLVQNSNRSVPALGQPCKPRSWYS